MGYHMATFTSLSSHITLANDFLLCSTLDFERLSPLSAPKVNHPAPSSYDESPLFWQQIVQLSQINSLILFRLDSETMMAHVCNYMASYLVS